MDTYGFFSVKVTHNFFKQTTQRIFPHCYDILKGEKHKIPIMSELGTRSFSPGLLFAHCSIVFHGSL